MKNDIKANENRIEAFKEKIEEVGAEIQAKYHEEATALEQHERHLKNKLKDYKEDGEHRLEVFRKNLKHDMHRIGRTMKALFKNNHEQQQQSKIKKPGVS